MVIGVSLKFEENVISEAIGSVPTVSDGYFLVLSVFQFLSPESIVFYVVDCFQIEN